MNIHPLDLPWTPPNGHRPDGMPVALRFKTAVSFCDEYVPLAYAVEPLVRSGSLYTATAPTGSGKTAWFITLALAVATGRTDILGIEVQQGRVALLTFENPDDVRMRLMIAAFIFNINLAELGDRLVILDERAKPEDITAELARQSGPGPFKVILIDTLAAFFDGDNINDAVQGGQFMRRVRPMTRLAGLPSVVVASHPVKNANADQLVPYGSGAILNEVDGNLTLWRKPETGIITLHWQGKLRGIEFPPTLYKVETSGSPDVLDSKGRQVILPYLTKSTQEADEDRERSDADISAALLKVMIDEPKGPQRHWAIKVGRSVAAVNNKLNKLKRDKLVDQVLDVWSVTERGRDALQKRG